MSALSQSENYLVYQQGHLRVWLSAVGTDAIRVQAGYSSQPLERPQALLDPRPRSANISITPLPVDPRFAQFVSSTAAGAIETGSLRAEVRPDGAICFTNTVTGQVLLEQPEPYYYRPPNIDFKHREGSLYQVETRFKAQPGERFWGLGQHQHGLFDQKGVVLDLQQRNTEVSIPFMVSNRNYGFLWNNPGIGRVELGTNATRWTGLATQQMDYVVFGGGYADILRGYADATGHAPMLPEFASGFWQCKLRYETQAELLEVAREYQRRGLPLSVIVADFFHWSHMGDWRFDPKCWPDPAAMTRELAEMGVKLMVSIWPTVSPISENYREMRERGYLIRNERGTDAQHVFVDHDINGPAYFAYYDATNPEAGQFVWQTVRKNYYDNGVRLWWLDNDEPDINPWNPENLSFFLGNGLEVANLYPLMNQQVFEEGMQSAGETDFVTLSRSGWAGSQRFHSVIWSGDVASTFEALRTQVRAGLNMAMSGIPWWTTDIGGFHGGDATSPDFHELLVRWFEYGVFCPITRLHGYRLPVTDMMPASGAPNEVWSYGEEVYQKLVRLLRLRESLRPYVMEQMKTASQQGLPVMRPLFVDFAADPRCEEVEDEYLFGGSLLVAPVVEAGLRERPVYLPAGARWKNAWTGEAWEGGQTVTAPAPLGTIPVFLRDGFELPVTEA